jgi:hypothetical protein
VARRLGEEAAELDCLSTGLDGTGECLITAGAGPSLLTFLVSACPLLPSRAAAA